MIDEYLKSANKFLIHQNKRAKQAEDYINGISDKDALEEAIAEWWRKYAAGEFGSLATSLPNHISDAVYQEPLFIQTMKNSSDFFKDYILSIRPELREAIIDMLQEPDRSDGTEKDAAGCLFGRVIALELAKNESDPAQMELAFSCFEVVGQFWPSFEKNFEEAVFKHGKAREEWIALLSDVSTEISAYFNLNDPTDQAEIKFEKAEWQKMGNPFYVWDSQPGFYDDKFIPFIKLEILHKLDFEAWVEALENLPLPRIKKLALMHSELEQDHQSILKLIRESSPVFDERGKWAEQRKTAALYGVMAAFRFAEKVFKVLSKKDPDSLKDLEEREIPEWFDHVFESVLERPDGKIISAGFIALLVRQHVGELVREHERGEEREWSLTERAIDILAEKLAEKCNMLELMQNIWKLEEESFGHGKEDDSEINHLLKQGLPVLQDNSMQYYLSAVLIEESLSIRDNKYGADDSGEQSPQTQKLWNWFTDLIKKRDPFIDYICNPHLPGALNWISYNIGRILAQTQEPVKEFSKAWKSLQHQRNRVLHQMPSNDMAACYPSQLLIRVGTGAILWTVDNPEESMDSDSAKSLWFGLFDSAYHLWSMKRIDVNSSSLMLLNQCIAVVPLLFNKKDIENPVRRIIEYFKTDSKMICSITWLLWKNGLPIASVDSLLYKSQVNFRDSLEEELELVKLSGSGKEMMKLYEELTAVVNGSRSPLTNSAGVQA
ncbi:hypothetical protein [Desulfonema magnum]|uniref:Uncharacterized protein n=1 Tax=Desulfonema magnum TaxID=45655 RepID=A0A975BIF3_9BACT|nr:hypothetical protein [Desulfonema magnum]QTA85898.1 Uncharacterized protein dnm_019150 [Desulfonema magnum]